MSFFSKIGKAVKGGFQKLGDVGRGLQKGISNVANVSSKATSIINKGADIAQKVGNLPVVGGIIKASPLGGVLGGIEKFRDSANLVNKNVQNVNSISQRVDDVRNLRDAVNLGKDAVQVGKTLMNDANSLKNQI